MSENKYTERQYATFLRFMDKIANEDNYVIGYHVNLEYKQWIKDQKLSGHALIQMEERLEEEEMGLEGKNLPLK